MLDGVCFLLFCLFVCLFVFVMFLLNISTKGVSFTITS